MFVLKLNASLKAMIESRTIADGYTNFHDYYRFRELLVELRQTMRPTKN